MKLNDLAIAYQLQKKFLRDQSIVAYKVGASSIRSAEFFSCDDILLGGIDQNHVFHGVVSKDYPIAEAEIIVRIRLTPESVNGFEVIEQFVGLECSDVTIDNPDGSAFICVADNCSAGDLILYKRLEDDCFKKLFVMVNKKLVMVGFSKNLKYSVHDILAKTVNIIVTYNLIRETNEILVATGGLTNVFSLSAGDNVEISYE